jgi:DnaJ-class molecular chaperone
MADDGAPPPPQPCAPCRASGRVLSNLGGEQHELPCPWCGGTGTWEPGRDAQEHPAEPPAAT